MLRSPKPRDSHPPFSFNFFKGVVIGAFFPTPVSPSKIREEHTSTVEIHSKSLDLHRKTENEISKINKLLSEIEVASQQKPTM